MNNWKNRFYRPKSKEWYDRRSFVEDDEGNIVLKSAKELGYTQKVLLGIEYKRGTSGGWERINPKQKGKQNVN
jgi:hypothetical protein